MAFREDSGIEEAPVRFHGEGGRLRLWREEETSGVDVGGERDFFERRRILIG